MLPRQGMLFWLMVHIDTVSLYSPVSQITP